ncbi:hypothetical protein Y032_0251g179 [Ancylostoma ceylanicum]|uniref:Uncharacterized protein n=1 Tax=Ancylostoma ceylanicum TaxID=53326 RepID=A0A016SCT5_9BILA|nr:hypothetical protein Y032_0251g179 [Ancylostoma ceylanicum]
MSFAAIMLLLVMKHEKVKRSPNWEEKCLEIALRRLATAIPARAARLRGVLVKAMDGSSPSTRSVHDSKSVPAQPYPHVMIQGKNQMNFSPEPPAVESQRLD